MRVLSEVFSTNWMRKLETNLIEGVTRTRKCFKKGERTTKLSDLKKRNFKEVQRDVAELRIVPRGMPWFAGLIIDPRCNLRCIMCIQRVSDICTSHRKRVSYKICGSSLPHGEDLATQCRRRAPDEPDA